MIVAATVDGKAKQRVFGAKAEQLGMLKLPQINDELRKTWEFTLQLW